MRTNTPRPPRRSRVVAFVASAAVAALALGGGAAYAFWTATATGTGTVTSPTVAVTHASFPTASATLINTHTTLTQSGSFTLTNTGTIAGAVTASVTGAPSAFASALPVTYWPGACVATPPAGAVTTTWQSFSVSTTLAAGASQAYCVRTVINPATQRDAIATTTGTQTLTATITAQITASGWTNTAPTASNTATFTTQAIYKLAGDAVTPPKSTWLRLRSATATGVCLDVSGSGGAGTDLISYGCDTYANKSWQMIPVSGTDYTKVVLRPGHAPGTRIAQTATGTQIIAAVNAADVAQQWYVQRVSGTQIQLVSVMNGKCLTVRPTADTLPLSTADCNGANTKIDAARIPLSLGSSWVMGTGTFSYQNILNGTGANALVVQRLSGGTWYNLGTTVSSPPATATLSFPIVTSLGTDANRSLAIGDNTMRIVYSGTSDVAFGPFIVNRSSVLDTLTAPTAVG